MDLFTLGLNEVLLGIFILPNRENLGAGALVEGDGEEGVEGEGVVVVVDEVVVVGAAVVVVKVRVIFLTSCSSAVSTVSNSSFLSESGVKVVDS